MKIKLFALILLCCTGAAFAQESNPSLVITGTVGANYEYYGLSTNPNGWNGYRQRKPWNQLRFNFKPIFSYGDFKLPVNFSFATMETNFLGPYAGIANAGHQSFWQFVTNPINNFGINPKYKWAEVQLGTQYLNYTDLTTGDVGVFGAGFDLRPKGYIIRFFTGKSQEGINYSAVPSVRGAYRRTQWMAQIGKEKEGKYKFALTAAKGRDSYGSISSPPPLIAPQEGFVTSFLSNTYLPKGFFIELESAQSIYSTDTNSAPTPPMGVDSFEPFFKSDAATVRDYAATLAFGKKSKNFDIGFKGKFLGAGFYTTGYPFQQNDKLDLTVNTRFNAWKDKNKAYKMNIVASIGERVNNLSKTATKANLLIANLNWFTQFNERWSLNFNYNNFGFQSNSIINPHGVKNVSNDFGVSPTYTWSNTKMVHLLSLNYSYSQYDERNVMTGATTSNKTHTAFLTYVPTFLNRGIAPDFSILYFANQLPGFKSTLSTFSAGLATPMFNKKVKLRGQLQYTFLKTNINTANNNVLANLGIDCKITKQLTWTNYFSSNYFIYGDESTPAAASYLETNYRTSLTYNFTTKKQAK